MKTIVTVKGTTLISIVNRALTAEEYTNAQRELLHRADQLSFDIGKWRKERQEQNDAAGIREQLRFYGPEKVWENAKRRRKDAKEESRTEGGPYPPAPLAA